MTSLRLGIDEAGRGCVLGPMVFGACVIEEQDIGLLRSMGTKDSKRLSAKRRQSLRVELESTVVAWRTVAITAEVIDQRSINEIGKDTIVDLVCELKPDVVVIDAPVPPRGIPAYQNEIEHRLVERGMDSVQIIAENKADDTYPCCAAASIFAKTSRDERLGELAEEIGVDLGSGYPGDPRTIAFLKESWQRDQKFPAWVRTKWETVQRIVAESAQGRLF